MACVNSLIDEILSVPYSPGKGDWSGADCWGIVEIWYRELFAADLEDRKGHQPGSLGLQEGFNGSDDWEEIPEPEDHCLVVMKAKGLLAGHIGVFYDGRVIHSDEKTGCLSQPINDRFIRSKISCFLRKTWKQ